MATVDDRPAFTHEDIPWISDPMRYLAPPRELTPTEQAQRDALAADLALWSRDDLAGAFLDLILDVQCLKATLQASLDVIQRQQQRLTRATALIERHFVSRSED